MSAPLRLYGQGGEPVPCATCGVLSDSWFPDGSPKFAYHEHPEPGPIEPYYRDALVTLYHGDYRMVPLPVDPAVLILDPPFDLWPLVRRIDATTVIAFTSWQHRPAVHELYGHPRAELVWVFADGRWVSHTLPRMTHETILVFGLTRSAYVGPLTDGLPVRKGTGSIGRSSTGPRTYTPHERKALDSVQQFPRDVAGPLGVWSKPLGLMSRLIEWTAPEGGLVLDPFAGSGTSLVAAKALNLPAVGVELDERHCEIAANRCRQETLGLA